MKYADFIFSLDLLHRLNPNYYSSELLLLADDVLRWVNDELTQDNSALIYLRHLYNSPKEAIEDIWPKIQLLANALRSLD